MLLVTLMRLCGTALLGLFVLNFFVPRKFKWAEELPRLSLLNRRIFQVHAIFIALILLLMGLLLLTLPHQLLAPDPLARAVTGGLALFWAVRLWMQWFLYDVELWRGKTFETAMHFAFSGLWILLTTTCSAALWTSLNG